MNSHVHKLKQNEQAQIEAGICSCKTVLSYNWYFKLYTSHAVQCA